MSCIFSVSALYENCAVPFLQQWRTARKVNRCDECLRPILSGQRYEFVSGKWDDGWASYRTCEDCVEIRTAFTDGSWEYGRLWENLTEGFDELTTGCFAQLTTSSAKQLLQERWSSWKGL